MSRKRAPKHEVNELISWAEQQGCNYLGLARNGHVRIQVPNGRVVTGSSTPSDVNGMRNFRRDIEKALGVDSGLSSGRYKKGVGRQDRYEPATERVDSVSAQVDRLTRRFRDLCDRISYLQECDDMDGARPVVAELLVVESEFEALGRRAPLRTFREVTA